MNDILLDTYQSLAFKQRYQIFERFSLVFKDSGLEQEYNQNQAHTIANKLRVALVLAILLYINFALLDYLLVPEKMYALWAIRACTCVGLALLLASSFHQRFPSVHQSVAFWASMMAAGGIFSMLLITHNQYSHYYYAGINLCITWTLFVVGLRFVNALLTVLLIVLIYNLLAAYKQLPIVDIISNNFFLVSNAIIGVLAGYTIEQHSRWRFYQSLVIKNNSSALHRAMIAASLDAVISINETGEVMEFSHAAERMFGYTRAEALGQSIGTLIVPAALRARHEEGLRRYCNSGEQRVLGMRLELQAMRKDGSEFPVELTLREVNLIGRRLVTAYIRDLSQQHAAEQEIARQRDLLQRSEKLSALGTLLAGVAHELNNPLTIVVGQAQLLKELEQDERVLKRVDKIANAAERCVKIVTTFLAMARNQPPQRTQVDLSALVHQVLELLDGELQRKSIAVEVTVAPHLPRVLADADQLHQIVSNLIINAQQAMENSLHKNLHIELFVNPAAEQVCLRLSDSGPGIPEALRRRIFEPFFTTKQPGEGTGLGLSVCNGIAEAHGGSINIQESTLGGACFCLQLPIDSSLTAS